MIVIEQMNILSQQVAILLLTHQLHTDMHKAGLDYDNFVNFT